ncbi:MULTISPECIES: FAD synthetase family protein [unclassified Cytobacillus]|uniref:FAD synthetase family protein n=1 Tax=unclassified Cytobacillus TaxID=2675268 RepID=UPI0020414F49|nr:FAD synthetase family protein [Cytobacillus sp. AMY 15.2]MCM3091562.1 FAD synthetase family protein [Cytobacillus sp. AMY 15.2]
METHIYTSLTLPCSVIAIGAFDGVHRGHQAVIEYAVKRGKLLNAPSLVYTFDPPPRVFFQGAHMLSSIQEKVSKLEKLGVSHAVFARFNRMYAGAGPEKFIEVLSRLNPVEIIVGDDFRFGKNREGDSNYLKMHFTVREIDPVCCSKGNRISSSRIRHLLSKGEVQVSNSLLGWPAGD